MSAHSHFYIVQSYEKNLRLVTRIQKKRAGFLWGNPAYAKLLLKNFAFLYGFPENFLWRAIVCLMFFCFGGVTAGF